jgi:hypothetical protein
VSVTSRVSLSRSDVAPPIPHVDPGRPSIARCPKGTPDTGRVYAHPLERSRFAHQRLTRCAHSPPYTDCPTSCVSIGYMRGASGCAPNRHPILTMAGRPWYDSGRVTAVWCAAESPALHVVAGWAGPDDRMSSEANHVSEGCHEGKSGTSGAGHEPGAPWERPVRSPFEGLHAERDALVQRSPVAGAIPRQHCRPDVTSWSS